MLCLTKIYCLLIPPIEKKNECGDCDRDLPEPDSGGTFPGVTMEDGVLVCFNCYLRRTINGKKS